MNKKDSFKIKISLVVLVCIFALAAYLAFGLFMVPMRIDGSSMHPTLEDNQIVYVQKALAKYELGTVIVFERPDKDYNCIKRIMGMPGDKIRMSDGKLYRNGVVVDDVYNTGGVYMDTLTNNEHMVVVNGEYTIEANHYFLLGDNRSNSIDSRFYGGVSRDKIEGKALFV